MHVTTYVFNFSAIAVKQLITLQLLLEPMVLRDGQHDVPTYTLTSPILPRTTRSGEWKQFRSIEA